MKCLTTRSTRSSYNVIRKLDEPDRRMQSASAPSESGEVIFHGAKVMEA